MCKYMHDGTENEITKIIKSQIEKEEEFKEASLNSSDGYYSIYDINLEDNQMEKYKKIMNQRAVTGVLKRNMPYANREDIIRYEKNMKLFQDEVACLKILLDRFKRRIHITAYYKQKNINLYENKCKAKLLATAMLMPELKIICNIANRNKEKSKEQIEL